MNADEVKKEFDFVKSLSEYYKRLVSKFKSDSKLDLNAAIIEEGRTDEEKEQLQELC
jgi:hypothetical protein